MKLKKIISSAQQYPEKENVKQTLAYFLSGDGALEHKHKCYKPGLNLPLLDPKTTKKVAIFGAGWLSEYHVYPELFPNAGIDIYEKDPHCLTKIKAKVGAAQNVTIHEGDMYEMSIQRTKSEKYDFIIFRHPGYHKIPTLFRSLDQILKAKGVLLITSHDEDQLICAEKSMHMSSYSQGDFIIHKNRPDYTTALELLGEENIRGYERTYISERESSQNQMSRDSYVGILVHAHDKAYYRYSSPKQVEDWRKTSDHIVSIDQI